MLVRFGYVNLFSPIGYAFFIAISEAEVTGGQNRASELKARFEKLALDMNKPAVRPARPDVGKIKPTIFAQPSKPTEEVGRFRPF